MHQQQVRGQLVESVVAVSRETVHLNRFEEAHFIVEAQGLDGKLTDTGKVTDLDHRCLLRAELSMPAV